MCGLGYISKNWRARAAELGALKGKTIDVTSDAGFNHARHAQGAISTWNCDGEIIFTLTDTHTKDEKKEAAMLKRGLRMLEEAGVDVATCIDQNEGNCKEIDSYLRINAVDASIRTQHVDCKFDVFHPVNSLGGQMPKMISANAPLLQSEVMKYRTKGGNVRNYLNTTLETLLTRVNDYFSGIE